MDHDWLHTHIKGACANIDLSYPSPELRPDAPEGVTGNSWYAVLLGVAATDEPRDVVLRWPPVSSWSASDYNDNHSFAEVLDRAIFMDHSDGQWSRLEDVALLESGARITIPSGADNRRLAVGMPVTMDDLSQLLAIARECPAVRVKQIGTAPQGTAIHSVILEAAGPSDGTFVISAHQHFSEWAGVRMMDAMIRHLIDSSASHPIRRYRWVFYPCINADALAHGWRGDPHRMAGMNLNRDWGPFEQPQTSAVRDHLCQELSDGPPLLHALDLHMGWHSRDTCGAGLTVFESGSTPERLIEQQAAFTDYFYRHADYTDFVWRHGSIDRHNLAAWVCRTFGRPGQTLEVSRHRWRRRTDGQWVAPSVELQRRLGVTVVKRLARFYANSGGGNP